jgi:hypothetical protein
MTTPDPRDHQTHPPEDPLAKIAVRQATLRFERGRRSKPASPALILQRTQSIHDGHSRWARQAGVALDYTLEDLRRFVQRKLSAAACPFCRQPLDAASFALTHKNPPLRGGRHALTNLIVCCETCRALKGMLDAHEFRELVLLLQTWPEPIRRHFLARFLAGRRRRPGPPPNPPRAA